MDEKRFEELWEQEQRQALLQRLQDDYPAWQRRRRLRRTMLTTVAVLVMAGFSLPLFHQPSYEARGCRNGICCNRSGIPSAHWAEVAGHILTVQSNIL